MPKLQKEINYIFFCHFLNLLCLFYNIHFETYEGIKTRKYTIIWIWLSMIADFCTRKRIHVRYISCSLVYSLQFMNKICLFFLHKFQVPITFFFIFTDLHDIYRDREEVWNFLTLTKKKGKKDKKTVKFQIFEKSQYFEKIIIFFFNLAFNCVLLLPFMHFFGKNSWILHIFIHSYKVSIG